MSRNCGDCKGWGVRAWRLAAPRGAAALLTEPKYAESGSPNMTSEADVDASSWPDCCSALLNQETQKVSSSS